MANIAENPVWEANIYELATTDPVEGGPGGIANQQAQQLANRTLFLKTYIDALLLPITSGKGWLLFNDIVSNIPPGWAEVTDMQGKFPIGQNMADATMNAIGQNGGAKTKTLLNGNLPPHSHKMFTQEQLDDPVNPTDNAYKLATNPNNFVPPFLASGGGYAYGLVKSSSGATPSAGNSGNSTGSSTPVDIMNPYRVVLYIYWTGI